MHLSEDDEVGDYVAKIVTAGLLAEALSNLRTLATEVRRTNEILKAIGRVRES